MSKMKIAMVSYKCGHKRMYVNYERDRYINTHNLAILEKRPCPVCEYRATGELRGRAGMEKYLIDVDRDRATVFLQHNIPEAS